MRGWRERLGAPVDGASLAAFRFAFGALMAVAAVRFWANGWIDPLYVQPSFHFTYWGLPWVRPLPAGWMHACFAVLAVCSALVAVGLFYRVAIVVFFALFTYVELIDQVTYLNHYYLISLLALLMAFMPLERTASLDALRRPRLASATAPAWCLWTLRAQLGLVYFFAGVAKLKSDWLLDAEPLTTWLMARSDVPVIGAFATFPGFAHAMSWGGALFDLSAPFALSWRRTRPWAYAAVVAFHAVTGVLFQLGMFPWVMVLLTPVFFAPDWPRRLLRRATAASREGDARRPAARPVPRWLAAGLAAWLVVQVALPLRHLALRGDVLWTEEGMRWAWHVMIVEKGGHLELSGVDRDTGERFWIDPGEDLTFAQRRMMAVTPDMLVRYAHHVRRRYAAEGRDVAIHADAFVAMNGRPARRLVDPCADLGRARDGLGVRPWLTRRPAPWTGDTCADARPGGLRDPRRAPRGPRRASAR